MTPRESEEEGLKQKIEKQMKIIEAIYSDVKYCMLHKEYRERTITALDKTIAEIEDEKPGDMGIWILRKRAIKALDSRRKVNK